MTGAEIREERLALDMTAAAFGAWLAQRTGAKPYPAQRIWDWENGRRPIPARVELELVKARGPAKKRQASS